MASLFARTELEKLARLLNVAPGEIAFLARSGHEALADFRQLLGAALFDRHEARFHRIAGLAKLVPAAVTVRIAEHALGPVVTAQVAGVLDPRFAAKVAPRFSTDFLADVAQWLDPAHAAPLAEHLPEDLLVEVGKVLLARREYVVLGRFVGVASDHIAHRIISVSDPRDLLQLALYTEDTTRIDALIQQLPDELLAAVVREAVESHQAQDGVSLFSVLSPPAQGRLAWITATEDDDVVEGVAAQIVNLDAWDALLPIVAMLAPGVRTRLVNTRATLSVDVLTHALDSAREQNLGASLAPIALSLDDKHVELLTRLPAVHDPDVEKWIIETSGIPARFVRAVMADLRAG